MSNFNKKMEEIFNVVPSEPTYNVEGEFLPAQRTENATSEFEDRLNHDLSTDYEKARDNIDILIEKGMGAIDDMLSIARESEKGRDFEVASGMIRNMIDASKDLLEIQKKVREMTNVKSTGTTNIKNAVFVGSTTDLLRSIKEKKDE